MATMQAVQETLGVEGEPRRNGKWLVWESMIGASAARDVQQAMRAAGITGFVRAGRGAQPSTIGVLAESVVS
jgi:hypothetical protein